MQAARKFESFCIDPGERWAFAGNLSGQIAVIDIDTFAVRSEVQAHAGTIIAMAAHPRLPYIACLGMDRIVSVWKYTSSGHIFPVCAASIRDVRPSNDADFIPILTSNAQTLGFHSEKRQIVTRSGNAGVLELTFEGDDQLRIIRCVRLHRDQDVITARYVHDSDMILSGSGDGELVLSHQGEVIRRWQVAAESIHWIEHLAGTEYLLASDARLLARVDISRETEPIVGPPFARDDFEQVTYNPVTGRAFASSFDRNVHELDPETCVAKGTVYKAPFKCRWLKTLRRSPATLIVQVRDGGMHKVDVDTGRRLGLIKATPETLWTAVVTPDGEVLLTGEGEALYCIRSVGVNHAALKPVLTIDRRPLDLRPGAYTKRMDLQVSTGRLVLGRTDGDIAIVEGEQCRRLVNLGSAVRDLVVLPDRPELLVACEDGNGYKLDLDTGKTLCAFSSPAGRPFWSLAYNPQRELVTFLERQGELFLLSAHDFSPVLRGVRTRRAKRAKWVDADRLLFSHSEAIVELNVRTGEQRTLLDYAGNTIEDFIWDPGQNYLVLISYLWMLHLYDFQTGQLLAEVPDQIDYSKGLIWLPHWSNGATYPLDFLTFGRSGTAHHFRIHNENLVALGPVGTEPVDVHYQLNAAALSNT